ncbi:thiol:disulfide interchange protein DsbA/DsbL [Luteimonas aquatica]|uniref:thiol:disulfide interchange protein DsbA/DsbL n=1 Tax=Luteimonas aquatica TaxID=450364 RepID=UPI001F58D6F8|nr:thiol:disulfide interchange protein DsbA/DsbL [Luteimonas aquatica]
MIRRLAILLLVLLPLAACAQSSSTAAPVEGEDYSVINGKPWQAPDGKIEVVEVFAYWCPHCAEFEPMLQTWQAKLPKDVRLSYLPAAFDAGDNFSRAFFSAEQLGVLRKTHGALFRAVHESETVPKSRPSVDELAAFYGQQGVDVAKFKAAMGSPAVDARMEKARAFLLGVNLQGTPSLIINGKYRVDGKSYEDKLRIADYLIAKERAAAKRR